MSTTITMPEPDFRMPISRYPEEDKVLWSREQMESYADARVREALEAVGAGGVSGQRITQPSTDEAQSAWFAGIDAGRDIERHNRQLDNDAA